MKTSKIIVQHAVFISLGIIAYFFVMKFFGLDRVPELRFLNFLFVIWGVNSAIKKNILRNKEEQYLSNLSVGIFTSALAVAFCVGCLIIYVSFLKPDFITVLKHSFIWGSNLSLPLIVFALLIEGIASSVICAFIIMQYWKNYKTVH